MTKEFLNTELKPYNALTREEKHSLFDAMLDDNFQEYYDCCEWRDSNVIYFWANGVYRTKPKEYKKLDIPWQHIDEKWKWAAMEFNNNIWFFKSIPSYDRLDGSWDDKIHNGFTTADCLKLDTTGIIAEHSLTQRPEGV